MLVLHDRVVALITSLLLVTGCASSVRHSAEAIPGKYLVVLDESIADPNEVGPRNEGIRRNVVSFYHLIRETMKENLQSVEFSTDLNAVHDARYDGIIRLTIREGMQGVREDREVVVQAGRGFSRPSEPLFSAEITLYSKGVKNDRFTVIHEESENSPVSAAYEFITELEERLRQHLSAVSRTPPASNSTAAM